MKKIGLIIYILINCSCRSNYQIENTKIENVVKIESILLPNNIDTRAKLTEDFFDSFDDQFKKNINITINPTTLELGKFIDKNSNIDIRTKVYLTLENGDIKKVFLDYHGHVLYNGNIYKGSKELLHLLRNEIIDY